jgi:hypothetical protein
VDQLVERIAGIQAQREALLKSETELKAKLAKKLAEQQERLKKIGIAPGGLPASGFGTPNGPPLITTGGFGTTGFGPH